MAVQTPTRTLQSQGCTELRYAAVAEGDTFPGAVNIGDRRQEGIHYSVSGTFGTGGDIGLEGSADGVSWVALTDLDGVATTITAAGTVFVREVVRYIRPVITAGTGLTLTITIIVLH